MRGAGHERMRAGNVKDGLRFALWFSAACIAGIYVHEIGHAVAGWVQALPIVPTPAKEYILRAEVTWRQQSWIAFGGVAATAMLVLGTLLWYARTARRWADAVLAGVLLSPCVYTLRFLIVGRGHDAVEWQAAQSTLGATPAGHAVDLLFLCLAVAGVILWLVRRRTSLRFATPVKVLIVFVGGIVLVVFVQVANNALFDRFFTKTTIVDVPSGLDPR